jgi:hypothetical protein
MLVGFGVTMGGWMGAMGGLFIEWREPRQEACSPWKVSWTVQPREVLQRHMGVGAAAGASLMLVLIAVDLVLDRVAPGASLSDEAAIALLLGLHVVVVTLAIRGDERRRERRRPRSPF